jgi:hypothetical protein
MRELQIRCIACFVKGWDTGGERKIKKTCPACGENIIKTHVWYNHDKIKKEYGLTFEEIPTSFDWRGNYKCDVKGCDNAAEQGTMNHHFFPKHVFGIELAERATQARLCHHHHFDLWHAKLTPNMSKKELD